MYTWLNFNGQSSGYNEPSRICQWYLLCTYCHLVQYIRALSGGGLWHAKNPNQYCCFSVDMLILEIPGFLFLLESCPGFKNTSRHCVAIMTSNAYPEDTSQNCGKPQSTHWSFSCGILQHLEELLVLSAVNTSKGSL